MKEIMCLLRQYSKVADKVVSSAFTVRRASKPAPTIEVTEAPTLPKSTTTRKNSARSTKSSEATELEAPKRPAPPKCPPICHMEMTRADMYEALEALGAALPPSDYAIIGGIACLLLGHTRETKDIDLIVPDGQAARVAQQLAQSPKFGTEPMSSGRHRVWFNAKSKRHYNVDVLEPRDIGQVFPSGQLDTVLICNRPVLAPAQLLNYKILGWTDRMGTTGYKKVNHARDILFLVDYMAKKGMRVSKEEIYHATEDFLVMFFGSHPEARVLFEGIGLARRGSSARSSTKSGKSGRMNESTSVFKQGGYLSA